MNREQQLNANYRLLFKAAYDSNIIRKLLELLEYPEGKTTTTLLEMTSVNV